MAKKYDDMKRDIVAYVAGEEGIGQKPLTVKVLEFYPTCKYENVASAIGELVAEKKLFRIRTTGTGQAGEKGFYFVFTKLPDTINPDMLAPITRRHLKMKYEPRDDSPICKHCGHAWGAHTADKSYCPQVPKAKKVKVVLTPEERNARLDPPPVYVRSIPQGVEVATAHPARKPGTFTANLEMPDGSIAVFTLDEVVRMYEQVKRILEAFSNVSL